MMTFHWFIEQPFENDLTVAELGLIDLCENERTTEQIAGL